MAQKVVQVGMSSAFDSFTFLSYSQSTKYTVWNKKGAYTGNCPFSIGSPYIAFFLSEGLLKLMPLSCSPNFSHASNLDIIVHAYWSAIEFTKLGISWINMKHSKPTAQAFCHWFECQKYLQF